MFNFEKMFIVSKVFNNSCDADCDCDMDSDENADDGSYSDSDGA